MHAPAPQLPIHPAFRETQVPIFERNVARIVAVLVAYEALMLGAAVAYGVSTGHLLGNVIGTGFLGTIFGMVVVFPIALALSGDRRSLLTTHVLTVHVGAGGVALHDARGLLLGSDASGSLSKSLVNARRNKHAYAGVRLDTSSAHAVLAQSSPRGAWSGAPFHEGDLKLVSDGLFDALLGQQRGR